MVSACQAVVRPRGSEYHNSQKNLSLGARARLLLAPLVVAARAVTEARAARVHVLSLRGRAPPSKAGHVSYSGESRETCASTSHDVEFARARALKARTWRLPQGLELELELVGPVLAAHRKSARG